MMHTNKQCKVITLLSLRLEDTVMEEIQLFGAPLEFFITKLINTEMHWMHTAEPSGSTHIKAKYGTILGHCTSRAIKFLIHLMPINGQLSWIHKISTSNNG